MLYVLSKKIYHCKPSDLEDEDWNMLQLHWNILQMENKYTDNALKKCKKNIDQMIFTLLSHKL
jgi:hypothetical protein